MDSSALDGKAVAGVTFGVPTGGTAITGTFLVMVSNGATDFGRTLTEEESPLAFFFFLSFGEGAEGASWAEGVTAETAEVLVPATAFLDGAGAGGLGF